MYSMDDDANDLLMDSDSENEDDGLGPIHHPKDQDDLDDDDDDEDDEVDEEDDAQESQDDSDFDPIGFGIAERIRQAQPLDDDSDEGKYTAVFMWVFDREQCSTVLKEALLLLLWGELWAKNVTKVAKNVTKVA